MESVDEDAPIGLICLGYYLDGCGEILVVDHGMNSRSTVIRYGDAIWQV